MSRKFRGSLALLLSGLIWSETAVAQLTPPAGSAGAGNAAISGVPIGPGGGGGLNNVINDPSGIGNASRIPPLPTNSPAPPVSYGAIGASPSRAVMPYVRLPKRTITDRRVITGRATARTRSRPPASSFVGICGGC